MGLMQGAFRFMFYSHSNDFTLHRLCVSFNIHDENWWGLVPLGFPRLLMAATWLSGFGIYHSIIKKK